MKTNCKDPTGENTTSATGNVTNMHVAIGNTALYICTGKNLILESFNNKLFSTIYYHIIH